MFRKSTLALATILVASSLTSAPGADIVANFDDGGSLASPNTTDVDGFPGAAGGGWEGPWVTPSGASDTSITASDPIDGGNYLDVDQTGTARSVARELASTYGTFDLAEPHTVEFTWRYDGDLSLFDGTGDSFNDRLHFFADSAQQNGTGGSNSWIIGVVGADRSGNLVHDGNWYFFDRDSDSNFDDDNMVDTGMGVDSNDAVYSVKVIVQPGAGTYDAQISDGTTTFALDDLAFRNGNKLGDADPVGTNWLHFGANANSGGNNLDYSLDSLRIRSRNYIWGGFDDGRIDTAADTAIDTFDTSADGVGGGGWETRWAIADGSNNAEVMMPGDAGFEPLGGSGGNYLKVDPSAAGNNTIRRRAENFGDVDLAQPHEISWQWRFDGDLTEMAETGNRIHFFADDTKPSGSAGSNAWLIGYHSGGQHGFGGDEDQWYFFDGAEGDSFNKSNMVLSGMELLEGEVYDFKVSVFPESGTYDARIRVGDDVFSATGLTFRNGELGGMFDYINFGTARGSGAMYQSYALDSIRITQIPEPGTGLLALLGLGLVALKRRRR